MKPGDALLTGVQGERYPVRRDLFMAAYVPVPQAEQDQARDTGSPRLVISLDIAAIKNRNNGQSGEANGGGQRVSCGAGP